MCLNEQISFASLWNRLRGQVVAQPEHVYSVDVRVTACDETLKMIQTFFIALHPEWERATDEKPTASLRFSFAGFASAKAFSEKCSSICEEKHPDEQPSFLFFDTYRFASAQDAVKFNQHFLNNEGITEL